MGCGNGGLQHSGTFAAHPVAQPAGSKRQNHQPGFLNREIFDRPLSWCLIMYFIRQIARLPIEAAVLLIRGYQLVLSPLLGRTCRFHPSCSRYIIEALRKYGLLMGGWKGIRRIGRCHPWSPGGYDPP